MLRSTAEAPSHSRLQCIHFCKRKYYYRYVLKLESGEAFPPAYMGSALHEAFECFHRTGKQDAACEVLRAAWGSQRFFGDWDWVTVGHAEVVLKHYMQSKHHSDWEVVKLRRSDLNSEALVETDAEEDEEGYLMLAEASFVVDIPEVGKLNLRPDLLLRSASGLRVVDHKTTSSYLGSRMYNEARFGHQLRLYAMGMGTLLGKPVLEAMINGVHAGKKASSDSFKGTRFDFYTFDYTPDDFEETIAWYRAGVEEMKRIEELSPQNPGSHCGYCDYGELCTKPPAFRPTLMKLKYGSK